MSRRPWLSVVALAAMVVMAVGSDGIDLPEPDRAEREAAERAADDARAKSEARAQEAAASGHRNVAGCTTWVQTFNALQCTPKEARISAAISCPSKLDLACDQTAFWSCMVENTRCERGRPMSPEPADCPPPC